MNEKILSNKKNGMGMLLLFCLLYLIAIAGCVLSAIALEHEFSAPPVIAGLVVSIIWLCIGWVPFLGLKVLKPQEALVLTLFGNYIGTLKEAGFYFVNPFCTSVNPASKTKLSQSGDVDNNSKKGANLSSLLGVSTTGTTEESSSKKISLKVMTLNNSRQKINDCLGNPIEIGIAVTWRVVDTAKAVFNVDNYKEYLSLQCDGALRNIVRIYPYDTAPDVDTTGDGKADEGSLRGSSEIVAARIREEIQTKVTDAGLEIIEACYLYDMPVDRITAAVHPQSIVHSLVELKDGAVMAQLATPDMRLPIAACLSWPFMLENAGIAPLDLLKCGPLTFEAPDTEAFPCLDLARRALAGGKTTELNAANEVAVERFLKNDIRFLDIPALVHTILETGEGTPPSLAENPGQSRAALEDILSRDARTRKQAAAWRA